jgi:tetratricopeptide (TPR) repeat protein
MKKIIYTMFFVSVLLISSCSDFTELTPKGANMLQKTADLEMLLNQEYAGNNTNDLDNLIGGFYYIFSSMPTEINRPQKTRNAILFSYDESLQDRMATLTPSDGDYAFFYSNIGTIANPILYKVDDSEGNEAVKKRIKGEAYCMRAWSEFIVVNKFAAAYNPATAETTPGIPYVEEDWDITLPTEKMTIGKVYEHILYDIKKALELEGLPEVPINKCRFNLGAAYALKAYVLMCMQDWGNAKAAARQALEINDEILNYWGDEHSRTITGYLTGGSYQVLSRPRFTCAEDYFTTDGYVLGALTHEFADQLEEGSFILSRIVTMDMMYDYLTKPSETYAGIDAECFFFSSDFGWNYYGFKTSQMYLLIAEAEIHDQHYDEAMKCLDVIRSKRINPELYVPLQGTVNSEAEAILHLKQTARAENLFSCYNFIDQKRWNQIDGWEDIISHNLGGTTYTLNPDSKLWIFPFPQNAVSNNGNLTQNYK